jgi:ABC-2 type transport system permease protein
MVMQTVRGSIKAQVQMARHETEDLTPLLTMPLFTLILMAIIIHSGRRDLSGYAVIAPMLLTLAQMGIFVASEMITRERGLQTLELLVATPAPFFLIIVPRIVMITTFGLIGFVESWLLARILFDVHVVIEHPDIFVVTVLVTIAAGTGTALISAALICFARSTRTLQAAVAYPLFLISGVLVPVSYLPDWLEPLSRVVFLYWSADLLRDSLQAAPPEDVLLRLGAIALLGFIAGCLGAALINRMLVHLKREGTLGLA